MRAKRRLYYADFETTTLGDEGKVRVYLWAIVSGGISETGDSIDSFLNYIAKIKDGIIFFPKSFAESGFFSSSVRYFLSLSHLKTYIPMEAKLLLGCFGFSSNS